MEALVQELKDQTIEAVYGDIHYVDDDDLSRCVRYYSSASFRPWKMRMGFQPAHPSFYCRRRAYEKFGTFDINFRIAADFENMLRLLYIGQIPTRYVPVDCVTMRTGGASTSGLSSHRQILADHLKAYRKNGVKSNVLLDTSRYLFKIAELLKSKL